jgi:anti-sigma B factor antagonist
MPPLRVKIKHDSRAVTVSVSGELDIASAPALAERAGRALEIPAERVVLDLSGLTFIDCAGGRALIALTSATAPGCPVVVRGASHRVRKVLAILDASLERSSALEPADGTEQAGSRARELNTWLLQEAQGLVSWAEQACLDSKNALTRAGATRAVLTGRRSLARDGVTLRQDGATLGGDGATARRDGAA